MNVYFSLMLLNKILFLFVYHENNNNNIFPQIYPIQILVTIPLTPGTVPPSKQAQLSHLLVLIHCTFTDTLTKTQFSSQVDVHAIIHINKQ